MKDLVLSVVYAQVPLPEMPHGFPVQAVEVRASLGMGEQELAPHQSHLKGRLIQVSAHQDYVSLTRSGVLRVEGLCRQPLHPRSEPRLPGPGEPSA